MNREIKFRAWDGKEMLTKFGWGEARTRGKPRDQIFIVEVFVNDAIEKCQNDGLKIMQFTGLKDKNGVEIYEGDIIRFSPNKKDIGEVVFDKIIFTEMSLEYVGSCFGWVVKSKTNDFGLGTMESEIIGNIYQNKELLTLSK